MPNVTQAVGEAGASVTTTEVSKGINDPAARQRRIDALQRVAGMWADRKDIPVDGLDYQRAMRDEWR